MPDTVYCVDKIPIIARREDCMHKKGLLIINKLKIQQDSNILHLYIYIYIYIYTILPKVLAPLLMKGLTALVISMSVNLNV